MRITYAIKWFSNPKGYGYTVPVPEAGGKDVFVHHKQCERTRPGEYISFDEGDLISFVLDDFGKGPIATEIRVERRSRNAFEKTHRSFSACG